MKKQADFCGWASKNDLTCSDGRIIRSGAFAVQDGAKVPLVYNHQHNSIGDVLGHAILENRKEGVYAYGYFNATKAGQDAKEAVQNGDITSMSIWANDLKQEGPNVLHGIIREVSLVLAGANPGAFIESVAAHGIPMDDYEDEGVFYTGDDLILEHAIEEKEEPKKEEKEVAETNKKDKTLKEIVDTMNDEQRAALEALVGLAVENAQGGNDDEEEEDKTMKHNIFSDGQEQENENILSHSMQEQIFNDARRLGSLKEAVRQNTGGDILAHASVPTSGMELPKGAETYGFKSPDMLYPDARPMQTIPEFISRDMGWVQKVLGAVHHTPFSRVKSMFANITEDEARALGYIKGSQKKNEVFSLLKRTTNPTTIYKLQKLDRDDILDITDFDVVAWIRGEMRTMLNEEIARAILIGDGREKGGDGKISEDCIRPVVKDVDLFNTKIDVDFTAAGEDAQKKAKAVIDAVIKGRVNYKGSGSPTFFTTESWLTDMLMIEDQIGHKLYKSVAELETAMRVSEIVTVEVMEGYAKAGAKEDQNLIGVMVNLRDYNVGQDPKAGQTMFDDFDIDYNRYSYLIETRMSGALTKPYSAVTFLEKKAAE